MSIASEITRISGNVADAYTAANAKGATMPVTQNSDNLATTISTIQTGTTPTGTKSITANGVYDVTDFASADVLVPTSAPAYYVEKTVDANGKLYNGGSNIISFSGVNTIDEYILGYAYRGNTNITGAVDMSSILSINQYGCQYMFYNCSGITSIDLSSLSTISMYSCYNMFYGCTSLTSFDLSSLKRIGGGQYSCYGMFYGCTSLTSADLSSLQLIADGNSCNNMFLGCTGLTSFDLSSLYMIFGSSGGMFSGCTGLTSADLSSVIGITYSQACRYIFSGCSNLASVNISRLAKIGTQQCLQYAFQNCTSLTELSFNGLAYTATNFNNAFGNMLSGCSNVTVHFPAEWQTDMSSWSNVTAGFGGTNTTVLFDLPNVTTLDLSHITKLEALNTLNGFASENIFPNVTKVDLSNLESAYASSLNAAFRNCTSLTSFDLSSLKIVDNAFANTFAGCTGLTSVNLSSLQKFIGYNALTFEGCTGITSVDLSSLTYVEALLNSTGLVQMFRGCTSLTNVNLSSLKTVNTSNDARAFIMMFNGCTSLTELKYPALKTVTYATVFDGIVGGITGCTIHFPSNFATTVTTALVGGTNTTVLYDLPAVVILTGANTVEYERNPKYDSATALAWRVNGTEPDTTTYYTSGLTDPTVGTTIYSDSACTVTETTVASIA